MDEVKEGEVEDLATLARLDETVLLKELKVRYSRDKIYVSCFLFLPEYVRVKFLSGRTSHPLLL